MKLTEGYICSLLHVDMADPCRHAHVQTVAEANGVIFECPLHRDHAIICWFEEVPLHPELTGPGRWTKHGQTVADLTLGATAASGMSSVASGCGWHGYVRSGETSNA